MKINCHREGMLAAFQVASGVVQARGPKPILRNVRLDVTDAGQGILLATDLEVGIRYRIAGLTVEQPGRVILPTSEFVAILRELPDETFRLEATESGIRVVASASKFDLPGEDPVQFPDVPDFGESADFAVPAGALATMIRRTVFAAAHENSRYALCSVLMEVESDGRSRLVATDGKRLALMTGIGTTNAKIEPNAPRTALIPPKALALVQKILQDPQEQVEISLRENEALFRTARVTIYTRLVEGRFPRYQDVYPKESKITVPLVVDKFFGAVRQSKIVTSSESKGVRFAFADGEVVLRSQGADVGESEVRLPISYSAEPLEITFDPDLLVDALRVLDPTEEITLTMSDSRRAAVFKTGDDYSYIVMPLTRDSK